MVLPFREASTSAVPPPSFEQQQKGISASFSLATIVIITAKATTVGQ